jgi:hypothetical protein
MTRSPNRPDESTTSASRSFQASIEEIIVEFTRRLGVVMDAAITTRGSELLASLFAEAHAGSLGQRARRSADDQRKRLVTSLADQLLRALERPIELRARELWRREVSSRRAGLRPARSTGADSHPADHGNGVRPRRPRRPRKPLRSAPPLDPEQIKRDAENARLRALLRPANDFTLAPESGTAPALVPVAPPPQRQESSPGEHLRALEKEIQDAVPSLAALGPDRCGAQIAVWAGQIRELRDRLPASVSATMRPAFRIFLEHLTELRAAMDAHFVDALEHTWSAPDWPVYIEVNRARVEQRKPSVSQDKLEQHHRAMLRALLKPHRRNVAAQALSVINAAAEVLPAEDGQLRSALRRHRGAWQEHAPTARPDAPSEARPEAQPETRLEASLAPGPTDAAATPEDSALPCAAPLDGVPVGEFDKPWTD